MRYGKHSNIAAKPFFSGIVLFLAAFATVTAQSVFIPSCKHVTCDYHTFVNRALDCDYSTAFFVCIPSFGNEYALSLNRSKNKLVYMCAVENSNIWYSVDYKKRDAKVKTRRYELPISKEQSAVFQMLAKTAVQTANNFHESDGGHDGTTYMLSYINDEVETWSPRKNSRTGRTVRAMDSLCYAVVHSDSAVLLRQMDTCRVLIDEFKHLYPLSFFYPNPWLFIEFDDGVSYSPIDNFPDSTFVLDPRHYPDAKAWKYLLESPYLRVLISHDLAANVLKDEKYLDFDVLNDSIAVWARELFLSYSNYSDYKINSGSYRIELYDTTATRCEITKDGYLIKMTASLKSLNRQMIISAATLNEGHYMLSPSGAWTPVRREDYPLWPDFRW